MLRCFLVALAVSLVTSAANASITLDNVTLDLSGISGAPDDVIEGIDQFDFVNAPNFVSFVDQDGDLGLSIGDTATIRGLIQVSEFVDIDGNFTGNPNSIISTPGLGVDFEITALFQAEVVVTNALDLEGADGINDFVTFDHVGGGSTFLNLFLDEFDGVASIEADFTTGLGFDDGTLIASFVAQGTGNGTLNTIPSGSPVPEGVDGETFVFTGAGTPGILFTSDGVGDGINNGDDIVLGPDPILVSLTSSETLELDGVIEPSDFGTPFGLGPIATDPFNFFVSGDGTATLSAVPEPTMLLVWSGLMATAVALRGRADVRKS